MQRPKPNSPSPSIHLGQLADPRREAEQLANARRPSHRALAELWLAIGDHEQATQQPSRPTSGPGRMASLTSTATN